MFFRRFFAVVIRYPLSAIRFCSYMIETVCGVVLRAEDLSEYDKRLTIYTRELGKLKAKVVGVKKAVSRLRGLAIPFSESRFQLYLHGTKRAGLHDPGKIVGGELVRFHTVLRSDWEKMLQCNAVAEILDVLTRPFYPNADEYGLLSKTLDDMEETSSPLLVRLRFSLVLLKILGYSLSHHPVWKSYSEKDRELLIGLGRWDMRENKFTEYETVRMENIINAYLSNYLSRPLKTEVFQRKMALSA